MKQRRAPAVDGALAGCAGTVALNLCAYLDMGLSGRAPSDVPARVARKLGRTFGLVTDAAADGRHRWRWEGFGEAIGLLHGVVQGVAYGSVRTHLLPEPAWYSGAFALMVETFAVGEGAAAKLEATEPARWGVAGYVRALLLRAAFAFVTAAAFEALRARQD